MNITLMGNNYLDFLIYLVCGCVLYAVVHGYYFTLFRTRPHVDSIRRQWQVKKVLLCVVFFLNYNNKYYSLPFFIMISKEVING